jgi:hypothetical protein
MTETDPPVGIETQPHDSSSATAAASTIARFQTMNRPLACHCGHTVRFSTLLIEWLD